MKIESERLCLYPISNSTMEQLIREEKDPGMKQAYREMLDGCLAHPDTRIWNAVWLMQLKDAPSEIVGDFAFKGLNADGMVEIGYGLRDGFCGKGYMTEAVRTITRWALKQEGVTRIEAETDPDNMASANVLLHAGYRKTGTMGAEGPRYVFDGTDQ